MNRRSVLAWLCRGMAATTATLIGLPGVQYVLGALKATPTASASYRRLARLTDLKVGKPVLIPVMGQKQDAWATHAEQALGRVWLVRKDAETPGDDQPPGSIQAFTSLCPHMGCQIQARSTGDSFVCPCHKATFGLNGQKLAAETTGERNHAPRGMDQLDTRLVQDESTGEWWIEVKYEKFEPGLMQQVVKA